MNVTLSEAAVKYGLNDLTANTDYSQFFGAASSTTTSWGPEGLYVGQFGSASVWFTSGFYATISLSLTSYTTATIQQLVMGSPSGEVLVNYTGALAVSSSNLLLALQDWYALSGSDSILGNSANNRLQGYAGSDRIDGAGGVDTVVLGGFRSQYFYSKSGGAIQASGPDGVDTLLNIERLEFDDYSVAFDIDGSAGQAYRLYQAAFDRVPDLAGLGYQLNAIEHSSLRVVAQNFLNSPEFSARYGSLDNGSFVTALYANVLHRAPDDGGFAFQLNALSTGIVDRAQLLINFSESPENQAAVIGAIGNGIVYQPV